MIKINLPFINNRVVLTFHQLVQNPTGKQSAYMASRERIKLDLESRYYKLLKKVKGNFNFNLYVDKNNYLFHFKIPSEKFDDLFYDVLINFIPIDVENEKSNMLNNYSVKLFSNSPAFTFTYTYVLNMNGLLIPFIKSKCNKLALTKRPRIKNPVEQYGFEKSIYFASLFIKENKLLFKESLRQYTKSLNEKKILRSIKTDMEKLNE